MKDLLAMAARFGVEVHIAHLDDPEVLGAYDDDAKRIYLSFDLTPDERRSVLAHELGHALRSDTCSTSLSEARANRFAAEALIDAEDFAAAERLDSSSWAIAEALGVTEDVVDVYKTQCLQRLGRRTYGVSRRIGLHGDRAVQLST